MNGHRNASFRLSASIAAPIPATDADVAAVGGNQNIRLQHRQRRDYRKHESCLAGPSAAAYATFPARQSRATSWTTNIAIRRASSPSIPPRKSWSRDVTMDIADELRRRFAEYDEVPASVQEFLETASR